MAKLPFNIKYRPQIESGEYKVETRDGRPARIVCWDRIENQPIVALLMLREGKEFTGEFSIEGNYWNSNDESDKDLFIVTTEPEMSEMELCLLSWLSDDTSGKVPMKEMKRVVKARATKLLDLAKQQLLQSGELLTQEHHEKLMETQYNETLDGVKKNWRDYFTPQAVTDIYNVGRNDVLKDLPRWEKWKYGALGNGRGIPIAIVKRWLNGYELVSSLSVPGEQYIMLSDLEKLPGFKEDESHE